MSKKIVRLTESDLVRIVKRVLIEQGESQVGDLLSNLDKFPQAPKWVDTFLKYSDQKFQDYVLNAPEEKHKAELERMGCTDMKKCVDELNRYGYELNKAYKSVDQELAKKMRNRIGALLDMVENLSGKSSTDNGRPNRPNHPINRPFPNRRQ